jgi:hypothetical protein
MMEAPPVDFEMLAASLFELHDRYEVAHKRIQELEATNEALRHHIEGLPCCDECMAEFRRIAGEEEE